MKLKSMTDFVLNEYNERMDTPYNDGALVESDAYKWVRYAKFLKQALKLEMFVPCDDEGNVLEEPYKYMDIQTIGSMNSFATEQECSDSEAFHKAKEKVLFEGFEVENDLLIIPNFGKQDIKNIKGLTIEALTEFEIELTPTAIKQIQP